MNHRSHTTMAVVVFLLLSAAYALAAPTRGRAVAEPNSSARPTSSDVPTGPHESSNSTSKTLLPEIAQRLAHAKPYETLRYPALTSLRHHADSDQDCLSCHRNGGAAKLPDSHRASKDHSAWAPASCDLCHMWESKHTTPDGVAAEIASSGYCLSCHANQELTMNLPLSGEVSLFVDPQSYSSSVHGRLQLPCVGCHRISNFPHEKLTVSTLREQAVRIEQQSCHVCHQKQFEVYKQSVHGRSRIEEGNHDAAGCTDCHRFHVVSRAKAVPFRMNMVDTCSKCHANEALAKKYGMSAAVTKTYLQDFHGRSVQLTRKRDPNLNSLKPLCYDCHGSHDIRRTDARESGAIQARLVATCAKCHKGAGVRFPAAWMNHFEPSLKRWPIVYLTDLAYKLLIPAVMGQFVFYILLDLMRWGIGRFRRRRAHGQ